MLLPHGDNIPSRRFMSGTGGEHKRKKDMSSSHRATELSHFHFRENG
jgi:hypothetical protein